jgi:hypothetical protein
VLDRLAQLYGCDIADLVADLPGYRSLDPANGSRTVSALRTPPARHLPASGGLPQVAIAERAGPQAVLAMRAMSEAFRTADRRVGGGALYGSVVRYLTHELAPQLLVSTGGAEEKEVFAAAASLTEAAGWMAHDSGDDGRARAHFIRALSLASTAGTAPLMGNVYASMSHLASQAGQYVEAARLAGSGLQHAVVEEGTSRLEARLHAMHAHSLAGLSHESGCRRALDRAEGALALDGAHAAKWVSHFDSGSLAGEAAVCLRRFGSLDEAERQARRAIELRPGDRVRSRALGQLTLAHVLADSGRIDEAASLGVAVCETARSLTSTRVVHRLESLRHVLSDHLPLASVACFLEALEDCRPVESCGEATSPWAT